jgi:hypothetical protein
MGESRQGPAQGGAGVDAGWGAICELGVGRRVMTKLLPDQPATGSPCNGCGACCAAEVCAIGRMAMPNAQAPCPALRYGDGRVWCGLVLAEAASGMPTLIADALGIGRGCCAS